MDDKKGRTLSDEDQHKLGYKEATERLNKGNLTTDAITKQFDKLTKQKQKSPYVKGVKEAYKNYFNIHIVDRKTRAYDSMRSKQSGGMVGASDMSAKKMASSSDKKKKMPQYYMGGGMVKKNKMYAYGGRVAKYKG